MLVLVPFDPPVSKAQNGPFSMGYDPTDYFDFEIQSKWHNRNPIWFQTELESLITKVHTENMQVYADMS
jgi:alpha-amylase